MPTPKHKRTTAKRPPPPPPSSVVAPDQSPVRPPIISLEKPPSRRKTPSRSIKLFRQVRSIFRSFPVINPPCTMPNPTAARGGATTIHSSGSSSKQVTGTLFGHRKSRVNLALQDNPRCLPSVVLELSIPTGKLLQDMGLGLVRIALECEKKNAAEKTRLVEEPIWTMYCNGRKAGYAVRRAAADDDLKVMQMLNAVSMGAGVLPAEEGETAAAAGEGEMTYMRAYFERVVGSKDSETYYMMNPDGNTGPELSIFFVRA